MKSLMQFSPFSLSWQTDFQKLITLLEICAKGKDIFQYMSTLVYCIEYMYISTHMNVVFRTIKSTICRTCRFVFLFLSFFFGSNEDLYRGDDEIEQEHAKEVKLKPLLEFTSITHL